jgi:capsular exopolysaccharide synthesis family protein
VVNSLKLPPRAIPDRRSTGDQNVPGSVVLMRERNDFIIPREQQQMPLMPHQPAAAMLPPAKAVQNDMDMLWGIVRHAWLVVIFALLGLAGAWFYLRTATPLYKSYSKIYIEPTGPRLFAENHQPVQRINFLFTQCSIIKNAPVLNLVAETPGIRELRTFEGYGGNAVLFLREYLQAEVGRKDDVIQIELHSPYPEDTAIIVNAVVDAYIRYSNSEKRTHSSEQLKALLDSKAKADTEIRELNERMIGFRTQHPTLALEMVITAELAALSQARVTADLAVIDAGSKFAAGHPVVLAAHKRAEATLAQYEQALRKNSQLSSLQADYQRMQTDILTKQDFAKRLEERIRELQVSNDAQQMFTTVQILEPAATPLKPSSPRRYPTIAVGLAAGVVLGAGLALLRDRMDGRMRSVEEIQAVVGLPVLGVVPQMSSRLTAIAQAMTVHLDPRSVVAESYRTVRTAVYFGAGENQCKTILVTSPEPGDGKTTSASNLAIAIAQTGRSVLLLDADFRKPTQHKNLDVNDKVGLSSVLAGRETLVRAIQRTGVDGLDILPCGPLPANPSEILNSREFGALIDSFTSKYDHVILDSPPVNAVTDARILGAVCDATILVVRADKSTRKSGEHARNGLMAVGARVLGVIVNDAPHRKNYEVYGGSYYGQADIVVRSSDGSDYSAIQRSLPKPTAEVFD